MNDDQKIIIRREELYERVWRTPATHLAKEYKMSDSRLGIICKKLKVPKPSPGYWMKIEHGKKVRRPPLPLLGPGEPTELEHYAFAYPEPPAASEPDGQALLSRVPTINVPQYLVKPDPLIKGTLAYLKADSDTLIGQHLPYLFLNVCPNSISRTLRMMDSLVKGFRQIGCQVHGVDGSDQRQYVEILGQRIDFSVKEKKKRTKHELTKEEAARKREGRLFFVHRWDYLPTGCLALYIDLDVWVSSGYRRKWSDTKRLPLEGQLTYFVRGAIYIASAARRVLAYRKMAEQAAAEQRLKKIEEERKQAEEEDRLRELDDKVARWIKSMQLRAYIREYERRFAEREFPDQVRLDFKEWVTWATDYANRLDPIKGALANLIARPLKEL